MKLRYSVRYLADARYPSEASGQNNARVAMGNRFFLSYTVTGRCTVVRFFLSYTVSLP